MTKPHPLLFATEGARGLWDASWMYTLYRVSTWDKIRKMHMAPKGDGSPVLVFPGFAAGDLSTTMLRGFLDYKGWQSSGWGRGLNIPESDAWIHNMEDFMSKRMLKLYERTGKKIHMIGWSLGGIYARERARAMPDIVQQVITMGSPIQDDGTRNSVSALFSRVSKSVIDPEIMDRHRKIDPPPVPCTAIYSKNDGIVHWEACLEPEAENTRNIEIRSSHLGMGFNAEVLTDITYLLTEHPQ